MSEPSRTIALYAGPTTQFGTYDRGTGNVAMDAGFYLTVRELFYVQGHAIGARAETRRMIFPFFFFRDITQPLPVLQIGGHMATVPGTKLQDCLEEHPPVQGLARFIEQHGHRIDEVTDWSLILPHGDEGEFTVRFTDNTGYHGLLRCQGDTWQVHRYAPTITIAGAGNAPSVTTFYAVQE